ncbi:NifB/NifX family molybdenum-iron cluster-binding protein [Cellulomonas soli]
MIVCIPVTDDGLVGPGWGRAARVALADVQGGEITAWDEVDVRWDLAHDEGTEGSHHARVARFVRERGVGTVVAGHMGPPMVNMLGKLKVVTVLGAQGSARDAVLQAVAAGNRSV